MGCQIGRNWNTRSFGRTQKVSGVSLMRAMSRMVLWAESGKQIRNFTVIIHTCINRGLEYNERRMQENLEGRVGQI